MQKANVLCFLSSVVPISKTQLPEQLKKPKETIVKSGDMGGVIRWDTIPSLNI